MTQTILIVDDDMQLTSFLSRFLIKHGFAAKTASSGAQTHASLARTDFDLIVLDLNLPDEDGLEIARKIRQVSQTPIIMLTARDEVFDRIVGLELGADDYLTKPYEPRELLARIKAVLRRAPALRDAAADQALIAQKMTFAGLELDISERRLRGIDDERAIPLTGAEYTLLKALAESAGTVLARAKIMDALYGNSTTVTDRAIDAHVARLRRKIDGENAGTSLIQAVHGEGYVFATAVETT
ncbi:response regulator [Thalassovita taeanensis]|uniref:Two-component system, OmpR family, phosphate regulon response regulator OmpR n=1 Tax=Thalassovita taeanensis TaxID=657014 RepID=A0A1H9H7S6_9RHOB|nr:response regulator transcription factor [Thalassovita taeanensis]SEQ58346.1 two-component system, OmpR family, phosphate regulon response regulator OmpR [Thalassovita taeanensis]